MTDFQETPGKETIEIEEGRLGDPFCIRSGEREPAPELSETERAQRGRIPEAVEDVAPDRNVSGDRARHRAPLERKRLVVAGSGPGQWRRKRVAGLERLMCRRRRRRSACCDSADAEPMLELARRQMRARPRCAVDLLIGEIIAVG